jgi:glucose/mannose-6-phosphate isomerase
VRLDEPERFREVDPRDALGDVEAAAEQWEAAAAARRLPVDVAGARVIVIAGMGGSGIAGDVAAAVAAELLTVPVVVHKGFGLPAFAGPGTVVVAVSHSGQTAETCDAAEVALDRGATLYGVAGGGRLGELCDRAGAPWTRVPRTTQPRHGLGFLAVPVLVALGLGAGLAEAVAVLRDESARCGRAVPSAENPAKQLGERLASTPGIPTILGAPGIGAVAAYRLTCQLAENAKLSALAGALPEATHNQVAAWGHRPPGGLVLLADPAAPEAARRVLAACAALAADRFSWVTELRASGHGPVSRLASLVAQADFASIYAALALGRDPTPIPLIDLLKEQTAS